MSTLDSEGAAEGAETKESTVIQKQWRQGRKGNAIGVCNLKYNPFKNAWSRGKAGPGPSLLSCEL